MGQADLMKEGCKRSTKPNTRNEEKKRKTHIPNQLKPNSLNVRYMRLASQFALTSDFEGYSCDFCCQCP